MSDPDARQAAEEIAEETTDRDLEPVAPERSDLPPLRSFNAFAAFDDAEVARTVVVDLEGTGIDGSQVSALALDRADEVEASEQSTLESTAEEDAAMVSEIGGDVAKGASIGAVAGALGGAAVAIAIPGVGAAIGAGIFAVAAGGAAAGTGVGGFAGAVSTTPASRGWEQALLDLKDGTIVIGVHTDDEEVFARGTDVLADANPATLRKLDADGEPL